MGQEHDGRFQLRLLLTGGFSHAYPRVSKLGTDPDNGLATVEALFLAYHILGRSTAGLLAHYHWADEFLNLNRLSAIKEE